MEIQFIKFSVHPQARGIGSRDYNDPKALHRTVTPKQILKVLLPTVTPP